MVESAILYTYVIVRTDIPLADQIVQVGHACLAAGDIFDQSEIPCHLVVIGMPDLIAFRDAVTDLDLIGIRYVIFTEEDDVMGDTSLCTEPITGWRRRVFRRYTLWQPPELPEQNRA